MVASFNRQAAVVETLLANVADINITDDVLSPALYNLDESLIRYMMIDWTDGIGVCLTGKQSSSRGGSHCKWGRC